MPKREPKAHVITMPDSNYLGAGMWENSGVLGDGARVAMVVVGALWGLRVGAFYQTLKKYVNILIINVPLLYLSLNISLIVKFAFLSLRARIWIGKAVCLSYYVNISLRTILQLSTR